MARKWSFIRSDGYAVDLSDRSSGLWVGQGSTGLDMPPYEFAVMKSPGLDGQTLQAVRVSPRIVNIPINVTGISRANYRALINQLGEALDPNIYGSGQLRVVDDEAGTSRYLQCYYADGLLGDDAAEDIDKDWRKAVLTFVTEDPYWLSTDIVSMTWGSSGTPITFFPFFPLKLGSTSLASGAGITYTNLVTNPSAELVANATVTGPGAATLDNSKWAFGTKSTKVTANNTGTVIATMQAMTGLTAGETYMFSLYLYADMNTPLLTVKATAGTAVAQQNNVAGTGQWQRIVLFVTPSGTTASFTVVMANSANGNAFNIDAVMVAKADHEITYIDGDQPNCSWNGTPHSSTSFRDPAFEATEMDVEGNVNVYPVWYATGPASLLSVTNEEGRSFILDYDIPSSRVVTIDTKPGQQRAQLDDGTNLWRYLNPADLFPLHPGRNFVFATMESTGTATQLSVEYQPRWRMVS